MEREMEGEMDAEVEGSVGWGKGPREGDRNRGEGAGYRQDDGGARERWSKVGGAGTKGETGEGDAEV